MTIGRIPKVDPGATQPQDRKPSPPAGRAASRRPRPARIGCRPNRRSPHPAPPSNRRPRRPPTTPASKSAADAAPKPAGKPAHPQTSSQAPEGNAQGSAKAFWQQQAGASTGSARPAPKRENNHSQQQSQAPSAQPQAQTTGGWKKTASGWSQSPAIQIERTACPPLARGQFEYHDYATVWQASRPTIHRSGPGPRRFYAKTRAREYRAVRFAQAQDKWYQDGQVTLTSDIVKTVTADHVRLFPATRRQSNSSTSRSHRKRCWRCESCP